MSLLAVEHLSKGFGGLRAIADLSFEVPARTVFSIIGPNGAGKTTLLNLMTGIYVPDAGRIRLAGQDLTGRPTHRWAAAGLGNNPTFIRLMAAIASAQTKDLAEARRLEDLLVQRSMQLVESLMRQAITRQARAYDPQVVTRHISPALELTTIIQQQATHAKEGN
jgi:ABC-type branched-subunit amino acid transport system ATPase component